MGSVGLDFKCPWCGRVGGGGYALYFQHPICTSGDYSCLWFGFIERRRDREDHMYAAVCGIFVRVQSRSCMSMILRGVASFL